MSAGARSPQPDVLTRKPGATKTVTSALTAVLDETPGRTGLRITNTHASERVSLGLDEDAVLDAGLTIMATCTWNMDQFDFTTKRVTAIASGGSVKLSIQEYV